MIDTLASHTPNRSTVAIDVAPQIWRRLSDARSSATNVAMTWGFVRTMHIKSQLTGGKNMIKPISLTVILVACGGVISSMATCPTKVVDNHTACTPYDSLSDTSWILVEIEFNVGNPDQQNIPEFKIKLRSWWDSLYLNFDLRLSQQGGVRQNPPPDSSIGESTGLIYVEKSSIPTIAQEDFITRVNLIYSIVTTIKANPSLQNSMNQLQPVRFYDLTGRLLSPGRKYRNGQGVENPSGFQTKE